VQSAAYDISPKIALQYGNTVGNALACPQLAAFEVKVESALLATDHRAKFAPIKTVSTRSPAMVRKSGVRQTACAGHVSLLGAAFAV
jgi:hypothetical protein